MMDWRGLIFLTLRIELRAAFWIDFLMAACLPIRNLGLELAALRESLFSKAKQNSQQGPLGAYLSNLTGRTVVIETLPIANDQITIYKEEEDQDPVFIVKESETADPIYIKMESETVPATSFYVNVSGATDAAVTAKIRTVVERIKLAGKTYEIIYEL